MSDLGSGTQVIPNSISTWKQFHRFLIILQNIKSHKFKETSNTLVELGMVVHAFNSPQEAEDGRSLSLRPT